MFHLFLTLILLAQKLLDTVELHFNQYEDNHFYCKDSDVNYQIFNKKKTELISTLSLLGKKMGNGCKNSEKESNKLLPKPTNLQITEYKELNMNNKTSFTQIAKIKMISIITDVGQPPVREVNYTCANFAGISFCLHSDAILLHSKALNVT